MNKIELKKDFIIWVEDKIKEPFPIRNEFLLACLDESIQLNTNSTFNGVKFFEYYSNNDFMVMILESWLSTAKSFLQLPPSKVNIVFREIPLPRGDGNSKLLSQLSQLALKCEN